MQVECVAAAQPTCHKVSSKLHEVLLTLLCLLCFLGTNALVIVERGHKASLVQLQLPAASQLLPWEHQRTWLLPKARAFVRRFAAVASSPCIVQLQAQLSLPLLSSLWSTGFRVEQCSLQPATLTFVLASISTLLLAAGSKNQAVAALAAVAIPAPLLLPK